MDFTITEQQQSIYDACERIFIDHCSDDKIKALSLDLNLEQANMHTELWQQLADSGILGIALSEQYGGQGLGLVELCLILELQGRTVAPLPLLPSLVQAAMTIEASDNRSLKDELLPQVAEGKLILSSAQTYTGIQAAEPLHARLDGDQYLLQGRSGFVSYVAVAQAYLISTKTDSGEDIMLLCDADADGLSLVKQRSISDEPAGYLSFDSVVIPEQRILAFGKAASDLMQDQKHRSWLALAAMQTGVLDEGLKRTADYVSQRKQFGRVLGAFQAVSQQAADAYMEIESLRSVYWRALDDYENNPQDFALSAAVAKYWTGIAGHKVAHACLHLHGGIGQDLDYPIHRYFLWAKQCERYLGSPDSLAPLIGAAVFSQSSAA